MLSDVIDAAMKMSLLEFILIAGVSLFLVTGICGVLGMGDDF